jgi:hypothetical protein
VWGTSRSLLHGKLCSEGSIKVTGELGVSLNGQTFVASQWESRRIFGDWKEILFVSASTTWTRGGLVPTDTAR